MNAGYSILFQKNVNGATVKDLEDDFGIVCLNFPQSLGGNGREPHSRTWAGEDGEDIYFPPHIDTDGFDVEIELGCKGENTVKTVKNFIDYLTGLSDGYSEFSFYNSYYGTGRRKSYYKGIKEGEFYNDGEEEVRTFTLTLHIGDPIALVEPVYDTGGSGIIIKLDIK